jgi:exodeoxyribonuclease VII large subunit
MPKKEKFTQQTFSSNSSPKDENITDRTDTISVNNHGTSGGELTHMRGAKIFTVSEISKSIKNYLESNDNFNKIWIRGEITNFTLHRSGHMYFDLKDEDSVIPVVMFKNANQSLKFKPEHGMKVIANGSISVYLPHGRYQFILTELFPDGLGALHLAYLQLKEKLSKEGLFALENKVPIPQYPRVIGVITSATGAAVRDIINVTTRRYPGIKILIAPSKVQGEGAAEELVIGLKRLHEIGDVDVIIIGRGGGSLEDLWAFNEEIVARAIFDSKIPIISAVGHETDFTISDFVADARAATPSAAAEMAVPDIIELTQLITNNIQQIKQYLDKLVDNYKLHLYRLLESPVFTRPKDGINQHRQFLDTLISSFTTNIRHYHEIKTGNLENYLGKLTAMNPTAILNRGYCMTLKLPENKLISSITTVSEKDKVKLILKDGALKCEIEEKMDDDN